MAIKRPSSTLKVFENEDDLPLGWYLLRFGEGKKMAISLRSDSLLGRKLINSKRISSHHAFIRFLDDQNLSILDLESKGGTYVNDVRVPKGGTPLNEWDIICLGRRRPKNGNEFGFFLRLKEHNSKPKLESDVQGESDSETVAKSSNTSSSVKNVKSEHVPLARKSTTSPSKCKKQLRNIVFKPRVFLKALPEEILRKFQFKLNSEQVTPSEEFSTRSAPSESDKNSDKSNGTNTNSASTVKWESKASSDDDSQVTEKNVKRLTSARNNISAKEKVTEWLWTEGLSSSSSEPLPMTRKTGRYTDDSVYEESGASQDKASDSEVDWKVSKKRRRSSKPTAKRRRGSKRIRKSETESSYSTCSSAFGSLKDFVVPDGEGEDSSGNNKSVSSQEIRKRKKAKKSKHGEQRKKSKHKKKKKKKRD